MVRILLSTLLGERRMTQSELSRKTGIRLNTINDMYHEMCESIKLEHITLICKALNCDLTDLLILEPGDQREHKSLPAIPRIKKE